MIQRFLTLGAIPELRPNPIQMPNSPLEYEVVIPTEVYAEVQDLIKEMRIARFLNKSSQKLWRRFEKIILPCVIFEKDRIRLKLKLGKI